MGWQVMSSGAALGSYRVEGVELVIGFGYAYTLPDDCDRIIASTRDRALPLSNTSLAPGAAMRNPRAANRACTHDCSKTRLKCQIANVHESLVSLRFNRSLRRDEGYSCHRG